MWRINADMYVTVPYNKVLFSVLYFFTSQSEVDFGMTLVCMYVCMYICMYVCKYICIMYECIYVLCVYVCIMCVCIYVLCVYVYMYVCIMYVCIYMYIYRVFHDLWTLLQEVIS